MILRAATASDLPTLKAIEQESAGAAHWSFAQYEALIQPNSSGVLLVACEGEDMVGFLAGQAVGVEWEVENVVVESSARRRGTATALMQEFLNLARRRSASTVFLEVRESNAAARQFYERMQFAQVGRRTGYYRDPPEDAIIYRLDLK